MMGANSASATGGSAASAPTTSVAGPAGSTMPGGSMNWEPVRQRLTGPDLVDALAAARELRDRLEIVHTPEFPLFLSALLPAFSSVLTSRTRPVADPASVEYRIRNCILEMISKMPSNEVLKPHAPHLVAVAMSVLGRDYEENALLASRIIFDLYKVYRSLPQDNVQEYLGFVAQAYKALPEAVQSNFSVASLLAMSAARPPASSTTTGQDDKGATASKEGSTAEKSSSASSVKSFQSVDSASPSSTTTPTSRTSLHSLSSFRVLTECPLIVMLMFQLYPRFLKSNIPELVQTMTAALSQKAPSLSIIMQQLQTSNKTEQQQAAVKRLYLTRGRELVAAQAKTLSFLTYLLRSFSNELRPFEQELATNVVHLFRTCPRESVSTRKELLVATRHLLNSDFRGGFFRHVDVMLDERVLLGTSHSSAVRSTSDLGLLKPLAFTTLSDLIQHVRTLLTLPQMARVVTSFSRLLHESPPLPLSTQYTAVRTLLSVVDNIFHYKSSDAATSSPQQLLQQAQLGRDLLLRILLTLVDKLQSLADGASTQSGGTEKTLDATRDVQSMIRAIVVGHKTLLSSLHNYRNTRKDLKEAVNLVPGQNEEVATAVLHLTHTEVAAIDRYILTALKAMKLLSSSDKKNNVDHSGGNPRSSVMTPAASGAPSSTVEKSLPEQHRDALTYFAAAFTSMDGFQMRRTLGKRLDVLVDAIVEDPMVMVVPRHLLASNPTASYEFCHMLLDYLVERMDLLCEDSGQKGSSKECIFLDEQTGGAKRTRASLKEQIGEVWQRPAVTEEMKKRRSTTLLQLFERILKSLTTFSENEAVVRRHLRRIVVICLRSSLEDTRAWPDNYCMLLRYVFRSISAGKFEESYKELLPLIPTVLNGLFRVVSASEETVVRHTAIELCLTIPARLSSLLPHMNLLLRVIIPALDSDAGDLVNLGLRTLEFWVDNLNPLFLYPEMSKQPDLFAALMQALSRHLRPAPYPYGLLTLRLLGKLGGKNRQFLREPMPLALENKDRNVQSAMMKCSWRMNDDDMETDQGNPALLVELPYPLRRAVETLKAIALAPKISIELPPTGFESDEHPRETIRWSERAKLWDCRIEDLDLSTYANDVVEETQKTQGLASLSIVRAAVESEFIRGDGSIVGQAGQRDFACSAALYGGMLESTREEAWSVLRRIVKTRKMTGVCLSLSKFLSDPSEGTTTMGIAFLQQLLQTEDSELSCTRDELLEELFSSLCDECAVASAGRQGGVQEAMCELIGHVDVEWKKKFEVRIVNSALVHIKSIPRELSRVSVTALSLFVRLCSGLYEIDLRENEFIWDILPFDTDEQETKPTTKESTKPENQEPTPMVEDAADPDDVEMKDASQEVSTNPREAGVDSMALEPVVPEGSHSMKRLPHPTSDVMQILIQEIASSQQTVRLAVRFLLKHYIVGASPAKASKAIGEDNVQLLRRVLFSRSLRLLPLPQQVGVIEGLATIIKELPGVISVSDQHMVAFLSELLKMCSVADGEMVDAGMKEVVVDKNGYVSSSTDVKSVVFPTHASALFYRREAVIDTGGAKLVVPQELPVGVQLRVSAIILLHAVIRGHTDSFFDAETTTPVGNIRPHVISLLFRTLVSTPLMAVDAAHNALSDVLTLSVVQKSTQGAEKSQSRLPKELLQTCIRPVLLHLREYNRLSVPLLRGLARLLSLLSSWFNKTLGEKLLDHLQKWTDPSRIVPQSIWKEGEEPLVAASIVDIFQSLPHASHFVEPLVKTCIKLEATLPAYKARFVESPYRRPLACYLNKHPQNTVSFFFPRLKTPMYSELFQTLVELKESAALRVYLCNKQASVTILNVCFERPLAIIRSDKSTSSANTKTSLTVHGIGHHSALADPAASANPRPMTTETLELQHQGFRLVRTLLASSDHYLKEHNDIVRAFRWLWRSGGRFYRLRHEDQISPRYHEETKMLASFLMSYAKSFPNEDLDILFELIRIFLQPTTTDFGFVIRFLTEMVSSVLTLSQAKQVVHRFFALISGDSSEDNKVQSIQFLVLPLLEADGAGGFRPEHAGDTEPNSVPPSESAPIDGAKGLVDKAVVEKFVREIMFQEGTPIVCGDRLKVELLRLSNLFIERGPEIVEPFRKEMVRFCWGLLKSEDSLCKSWAYVVVCRFIAAFETPAKIITQVYTTLLRSHQQEGRELVRKALDVLVPALPTRLAEDQFKKIVEQTGQMMLEDGNSTPQLAHISQTIVKHPEVFYSHRSRFVAYMINSLSRLALMPNCPIENRTLAVDSVNLLMDWEERRSMAPPPIIVADQVDVIANFVVRLKMVIAEPFEGRNQKIDSTVETLDRRVTELLRRVISKWDSEVRIAPFEKVMARDTPLTASLLSSLEVFQVLASVGRQDFFQKNASLLSSIITVCVRQSRDEQRLRIRIKNLVLASLDIQVVVTAALASFERILIETTQELRKTPTVSKIGESSRQGPRSRDRPTATDDSAGAASYALFATELVAKICERHGTSLNAVATSLLSLVMAQTKNHLTEATAKQRQGSTTPTRAQTTGPPFQTPTLGILNYASNRDPPDGAKAVHGRVKGGKDEALLSVPIRCLITSLTIFESSDMVYGFSQNRKMLFQMLSSILEGSDCVMLLMVATRCVGKWLLAGDGTPLTLKERNSLLSKLAAFDYNALADDVSAQPLTDLICHFVKLFIQRPTKGQEVELPRLLVACLLNAERHTREELLSVFLNPNAGETREDLVDPSPFQLVSRFCHSDLEGLGGRFWITLLTDILLSSLRCDDSDTIPALRVLVHGSPNHCVEVFEVLLPAMWSIVPGDKMRVKLVESFEWQLSRSFNSQLLRRSDACDSRCINSIRPFVSAMSLLNPVPILDTHLLVSLAENYKCWFEVLWLLEKQYGATRELPIAEVTLSAMRHCYRSLSESGMAMSLSRESCKLPKTARAISLDVYGMINEAVEAYSELVADFEASATESAASDFEMDLWEERWISLQKDLCQHEVVTEYARTSGSPRQQLECAWKSQNWNMVRSLCSSTPLLHAIESGDPIIKMSETLLAVADGKLSDVENLHAQTAQLCLYKWQLLPQMTSGSLSHVSLLHFFHRLVEIRESGQIMVETSNHSNGNTLPDLKNLLSAWRHRLPNDWEDMSMWEEIFSWRSQMFSAITANFHWSEPNKLASLHDRPWTAIRLAKTARKQDMRDVALLLLSRAVEERAMNVSDAFLKLREQILVYDNRESDLERTGGLNLINATNLSFFDSSQKSELFRLKAHFLAAKGNRSQGNQAYCHSLQISPSHARAWNSWGDLCTTIGVVAEKSLEQRVPGSGSTDPEKEPKLSPSKIAQYYAQGMGCYLEAIQIDGHEWARIHIPKCLWLLTKDGSTPGILCQTLETRGSLLPAWVWLPWIPSLLTSLYRPHGKTVKAILANVVKCHPQAVYYPLRAFYLERRDVDRVKGPSQSTNHSVAHGEEMMALLRRSHACLWSVLESILEELIVKFRPSYEEELLSTIIALLERAETQTGLGKGEEEENVISSVWRTLCRIAAKFFRPTDQGAANRDERSRRTAAFKDTYKAAFESDFHVSSSEAEAGQKPVLNPPEGLSDVLEKLRKWKAKLEDHVLTTPKSISLVESSTALAMFGVGDAPDLWPGACDTRHAHAFKNDRENAFDTEPGTSTTSSSAAAARKAALVAANATATASTREGVGGEYGSGSACIEIPGQYVPNSGADVRPNPELHAKLLKIEPTVAVLRRNDQLVRRVGLVASDGKTYRFLLQFAIPYWTRTDERTSQVNYVLDKILRRELRTCKANLSVQPHPVIPVAQRLRLISEPDARNSLEDVYRTFCERHGKSHSAVPRQFADTIKQELDAKITPSMSDRDRQDVEKSVRLESFNSVLSAGEVPENILANHLSNVLKGPEPLFHFRRVFAQQWAANCLLQYAFSVAERTPNRVVFIENCGRVLSPDFRISYSSQGFIEGQSVPFRLSPNVVNLIGFPLLDARYTTSVVEIAGAVRARREEVDPIFRLLLRDDLVAFFTKSMAKSDAKTQEMEKQLVDRIGRNAASVHTRMAECSVDKRDAKKEMTNPIDQRVRDLMAKAQNSERLAMMPTNYQAWL